MAMSPMVGTLVGHICLGIIIRGTMVPERVSGGRRCLGTDVRGDILRGGGGGGGGGGNHAYDTGSGTTRPNFGCKGYVHSSTSQH